VIQILMSLGESICARSNGGSAARRAAPIWSIMRAAWWKAAASKLRSMRSSGSALPPASSSDSPAPPGSCKPAAGCAPGVFAGTGLASPVLAVLACLVSSRPPEPPEPRCRWAQAQTFGQLRQGFGGVAAVLEADSQVEVVVGLIWVGRRRLAEERNAVLAVAGQRNSLIVQTSARAARGPRCKASSACG